MKFLPTNVEVKISEKNIFFGLFEKKNHSSRCVEEGRGAQLPTPHSASELAFIGDHFTFQHYWSPESGDLYLFSNSDNCFLYPSWPWSPRRLVWANWWPLSFFSSFCLSLRFFSAFLVTYIVSVILISFLQVDLGRQEGWFGPKRGVYLGGRLEVSCLPNWDEFRKNIESKNLKIKNLE